MKYQNFDGPVEELVRGKIKEIEKKEHVKVLHAVESGSRAWGIASPDSDYDVRFVYVRPLEYYLGLEQKKDFIDWELNETLDINGWDLSKTLRQFHKSNATLFEWSDSPIVYHTTPEWEQVREISKQYFSCKSAMYHYYGTANKNYLEYLTEDMVKYKKYFYVLRPILACKWIAEKKCPPPVLFREMAETVLEEDMKPFVEKLISAKTRMTESEKGKRIEALNDYIVKNLEYLKAAADKMTDDRNPDWDAINQVFLDLLQKTD